SREGALGDTILLIPALRELKRTYPSAKMTFLATAVNYEAAKACPYLDEVIKFEIKKAFNPFYLWRLLAGLRKLKCSHAIDADQWLRVSALLAFFSGAPKRIGFQTPQQGKDGLFTDKIPYLKKRHERDAFLDLVLKCGATVQNRHLEFWLKEGEKKEAKKKLQASGIGPSDPYMVIHPEVPPHRRQKAWPEEKFVALIEKLLQASGLKLVVTGTSEYSALKNRLPAWCRQEQRLVFLPKLELGVYAAVLCGAKMLLCHNTGIMHLAAALRVPLLALHGPIASQKWGPLGENSRIIRSSLDCAPCIYLGFEYSCAKNLCMQAISPEQVLLQIWLMQKEFFQEKKPSAETEGGRVKVLAE
ncbi:MAG: glycosyltransferase family 9 protein, partial [Parachlamydiales bacterium]